MNELTIRQKIYEIRGQRVMLDFDLAAVYGVETAQLKRQVRRNIDRFEGEDFMFEVSHDELLRCQIGTSSWGGSRYGAFAFTMLGVAMLSSVLRSEVAIRVNRDIMRAFVSLRQIVMFPDTSRKFPKGYVLEVDREELISLRSKNLTANNAKSRVLPKAFTEKGLYMLATILKGDKAIDTTIAIIEAFAKLRELSRTIGAMTKNPDEFQQKSLMQRSGEIVDDLFGDDFSTTDTETEIELNFAVLKLKHTIKRKKQ